MFSVSHWRNANNVKAQKDFDAAIGYLEKNSQFAAQLITDLRQSSKTIKILVNFNEGAEINEWRGPKFDMGKSGGEVHWNSERKKVADKPSAALGLMHELGHAYQFVSEKAGVDALLKPVLGRMYQTGTQSKICSNPSSAEGKAFIEGMEDTNVAAIELTVATEINASLQKQGASADLMEPKRTSYLGG